MHLNEKRYAAIFAQMGGGVRYAPFRRLLVTREISKELELELELIQTHMTQKPMLRVEVGKVRLCGLLSLGDSKSIFCFSAPKQQKTEEIMPDQRAFLFLVETTGTVATRVLIGSIRILSSQDKPQRACQVCEKAPN
jgi:hypothetical protein